MWPDSGAGAALGNASAKLLRDWVVRGHFIWLLSEEVLAEYKEVLARLGVRRTTIGRLVNLLREEAEFVPVRRTRGISPDPADEVFCACAEMGRADFLVTLNLRDFPQDRLRARVVTPGEAF